MGRRLTSLQTEEVKYALAKLDEYLEDGDRDKARLASSQLHSFVAEEGYRRQCHDYSHLSDAGLETR